MMSIENNVDDLNLDFSDRNCEAQQNNGGKFMYDFLLHDSGSEADSESDISTHEEVDLDDEYFFDNKIDFSHYLPKVPPKKESLDPVDIKRQEVVAKVQDVFSNVVKPVSRTNSVEIPNGNLNVNKTNIDVVVDAVGDVTEGVQDCDIDVSEVFGFVFVRICCSGYLLSTLYYILLDICQFIKSEVVILLYCVLHY